MRKIGFIKSFWIASCMTVALLFIASCGAKNMDKTAGDSVLTETEAKEEVEPETTAYYEFEAGTEYSLMWADEFDGSSLDESKWSYQLGDGADYGTVNWGNGEFQVYTKEERNISVSDGTLKITALKEKLPSGVTGFTSARIRTLTDDNEVLFSTAFGRVEAKIKIEGGSGIWPAFWMLPADPSIYGNWAASGEIDIMEVRGRVPNMSTGTAHFGRQWPGNVYKGGDYTFKEGTDVTDYHVYAVEWEPEEIRWYIDEDCFFTLTDWYSEKGANATAYTNPAPFDVPFYILLNVAVGGNFDPEAKVNDESFPGIMAVDYVRVYQKTEGYADAIISANAKGEEVIDEKKEPLNSGNCIYNGTFDQGINHIAFWKMDGIETSVDPFDYSRKLNVKATDGEVHRLYQTGLSLEEATTYGVRVDVTASEPSSLYWRLLDDSQNSIMEESLEIEGSGNQIIAFKVDNVDSYEDVTFEINFENGTELLIDNVMLQKLSK